jgi:hypothetical protein
VLHTTSATSITLSNRYLLVFFHNLKGYDGHLIRRGAFKVNQEIGGKEISAIPNSNEKFMSFKIGVMKFIDSYAFFGGIA